MLDINDKLPNIYLNNKGEEVTNYDEQAQSNLYEFSNNPEEDPITAKRKPSSKSGYNFTKKNQNCKYIVLYI